jgi:3' terminal RNA ribose 2'-O-methyltransferase Hen1
VRERPDLAEARLPLSTRLAAVPARGGEGDLRRLFEPLGYAVAVEAHPLDPAMPGWGASPYFTLQLRGEARLRDLLAHLYVLIPALDEQKHYWVDEEEVAKLLRHGAGWLAGHPERESIAARYLKRRRPLVADALARLADEGATDPDEAEETAEVAAPEAAVEERVGLREHRLRAVLAALIEAGARRVLDLGCGEGRLLTLLAAEPMFAEVVGVDVSVRELERARRAVDRLPAEQRERVTLLHGALTYRDRRLEGYDAAAAIEVIEHLDPGRLAAFERAVFGTARPGTVVVTTPNREYNARFPDLASGELRHPDHRFEWDRDEFRTWAEGVAERFGYAVEIWPVGEEDLVLGPPTQMAILRRS